MPNFPHSFFFLGCPQFELIQIYKSEIELHVLEQLEAGAQTPQ